MSQPALVFATAAYAPLADGLIDAGRLDPGKVERVSFPDGEHDLRIASTIAGRDAVVVGGTISDADTLEIFDLACGLVALGARTLTLVVPYLGYATMERESAPGQVVTAKARARLLSSIPRARRGNRLLLFELHTDGLPHYFEGDLQVVHLAADPLIVEAVRDLAGGGYVLGSVDAGRGRQVQALAHTLGVPAALVLKRRLDARRTALVTVSADVKGRVVVIYDDMVRTGGSLLGAATAYRDAGALRVAAMVTHAVLPEGTLEKLRDSGLLERIVCTDSHPRALACADGGFLRVVPIAPLLADALAALG